jgi:hypothetical protein
MPWHTPSRGFVRSSTDRMAAAGFEKLEDRVAVAATATLAASGIIFDGAAQIIVPKELPPISKAVTAAVHTDPLGVGHGQPAHHKKHKGGGGVGHGHAAAGQQGHKKQNDHISTGVKSGGGASGLAGGSTTTVKNSSGSTPVQTTTKAPGIGGFASGGSASIPHAAAAAGVVPAAAATSGAETNVSLEGSANWSTSINGGSSANAGTVVRDAGGFTLREGDSFRTAVSETFMVPGNPGKLTFSYDHLAFDSSDDSMKDALEISLLNPATNEPLAPAFAAGRDAFLNISEGVGMAVGAGVTTQSTAPAGTDANSARSVSVDISQLAPGTAAKLIVRLINPDHDHNTSVHLNFDDAAPKIMTMGNVAGNECSSVALAATFTDDSAYGSQTSSINWGDGTSSNAAVTAGAGVGNIAANHIYADNGQYTITLHVLDAQGNQGTKTSVATIGNVAPTLEAGLSFDANTNQQLETTVSGRFTDPGFTRASAGTMETFTGSINWGDGSAQNVPLSVVEGHEGVLTSGTFSISHVYPKAGIYSATITVRDDDGGQDSETMKLGIMHIDVVSQINLKSNGSTRVKIFSEGNLDASDPVSSSLRFGPGGASSTHTSNTGFGAMAHFSSQASGIRPTDTVAFLTGELADGTTIVGMDSIWILPGSSKGRNGVIGTASPKFFVADPSANNVYRYTGSGGSSGFFPADALVSDVRGIAANLAGDTIWQIDANTHAVVVSGASGTLKGFWTANGVSQPTGITTDGKDIWIVNAASKKIFQYIGAATRMSGIAEASSSFNLNSANTNASDIVTNGKKIWVSDEGSDEVFVYSMSGSLLGRWKLDAANADASGITLNPAAGNDLWVVDRADLLVYHYANSQGRLSGTQSAADTFALAAGNVRPEGIADPLVTNPNDPRAWQKATMAMFAEEFFGANTLANRRKLVDQKMLDDGRFDLTNTFPATLMQTPWSMGTGGSTSHRGGRVVESLDTKGTGSFAWRYRSDISTFKAANSIDRFSIETSDTVGDTVFDLGVAASKAAVFATVDHGPLPDEVVESSIYLSNDRVHWTQAVVQRLWLEGWNKNLGIKWDGFVFAVGTATGQTFRYASVTWGGPGALESDGDNEFNGILGLNDNFEPAPRASRPSIFVDKPEAGTVFVSGSDVLVNGHALAPGVNDDGQAVPNSITGVSVEGHPVDALDADGDFFTLVHINAGPNVFHFTATDQYGQTANTLLTLIGNPPDAELFSHLGENPATQAIFGRTSFVEKDGTLWVDMGVRNTGTVALRQPIFGKISNISDAGITVKNADGTFPDGAPYFNFSGLAGDGVLSASETSGKKPVAFANPSRKPFDFNLKVFAKLNEAPAFSNVPIVVGRVGQKYQFDANASDADNDTLTFSPESAPAGMTIDASTGLVTWTPTAAQAGRNRVSLKVIDGQGGSDTETFTVLVGPVA